MDGDLIPIRTGEIGGRQMDCVNLRDVWEFIESKRQFANWIKERLVSSELYTEGEDWVVNKISNNPKGGRPTIEYFAPLDVSKEIALGDSTPKAKLYRKWIIARESKLAKIESEKSSISGNFEDPEFLRFISTGLMQANDKLKANVAKLETNVVKLETIVVEKTKKADGFDKIANHEGLHGLREVGKLLGVDDWFEKLHKIGWIFKQGGSGPWKAYKDKMDQGLLKYKTFTTEKDGVETERLQTLVTTKGLTQLTLIFSKPKQKTLLPDDEATNG